MSALREVCHCGHDIDTHHVRKHACLGMGCNDCPEYRDASKLDPLAVKRLRKPDHAARWNPRTSEYDPCDCFDCRAWRAANPAPKKWGTW